MRSLRHIPAGSGVSGSRPPDPGWSLGIRCGRSGLLSVEFIGSLYHSDCPTSLELPVIRWFAILSLLQVVAFWKIFSRMGFPPWLSIMASIPLVNLIVLYYVALTPWPVEAPARLRDDSESPGDADFRP